MVASQTAARLGIDNTPSKDVINNLENVANDILQPIRDYFDLPVIVSSGYRSPELNKAIGGSIKSQHVTGHAVDFEVSRVSNYDVAKWIIDNLETYDQLILEFYNPKIINSGWVHCSHVNQDVNRKQVLTAAVIDGKVVYKSGLIL